jgi:hypothetical protein
MLALASLELDPYQSSDRRDRHVAEDTFRYRETRLRPRRLQVAIDFWHDDDHPPAQQGVAVENYRAAILAEKLCHRFTPTFALDIRPR